MITTQKILGAANWQWYVVDIDDERWVTDTYWMVPVDDHGEGPVEMAFSECNLQIDTGSYVVEDIGAPEDWDEDEPWHGAHILRRFNDHEPPKAQQAISLADSTRPVERFMVGDHWPLIVHPDGRRNLRLFVHERGFICANADYVDLVAKQLGPDGEWHASVATRGLTMALPSLVYRVGERFGLVMPTKVDGITTAAANLGAAS